MIGARDVLLLAAEWLKTREVAPIDIGVARRPDLLSGGVVWTATIHVDQATFQRYSKAIVRERVHGVPATSWRSQVEPRVHLLWVELDSARRVAPTLPPEFEPAPFDVQLAMAFGRLQGPRGLNLVPLSDLRAALDVPREEFDRELYDLRRADRYVLHTHDGRSGPATPEQIAGAIVEDGRTFVYVARRDPEAA